MEWNWRTYLSLCLGTAQRQKINKIFVFLSHDSDRMFNDWETFCSRKTCTADSRGTFRGGQLDSFRPKVSINIHSHSPVYIFYQHLSPDGFPNGKYRCTKLVPVGHHGSYRAYNLLYCSLYSEVNAKGKSFDCDGNFQWNFCAGQLFLLGNNWFYWSYSHLTGNSFCGKKIILRFGLLSMQPENAAWTINQQYFERQFLYLLIYLKWFW